MDKKRYIFDLDRTLLTCDYEVVESAIFEPIFKERTPYLMENIGYLLNEYEMTHSYYEDEELSDFLTRYSGLKFTPKIIRLWNNTMLNEADTIEDGVIEVLDHLKSTGKSLVVLTNWYSLPQVDRLKKAEIYDYFDDVFTGEYQLKPHSEAYIIARGEFEPKDCLVIGDNIIKDYVGPRINGIDAILYDKNDKHDNSYVKIKKIKELIR
ncbi:MAG: HAD family hydrolase [Bacilli bacterium]|nr:HAD family hydrolase [Bacilli bacterium]